MSSRIRLLVVDDEPDMLRSLGRILRRKDYEIETAQSGPAAIKLARRLQPDGVLMDIRMPEMNGIEAYRQIRRDCPNAFVCFMTAYSDLADQAHQESRAAVLAKPLDVEAMCTLIEREAGTRPVLIVDDDPDFCQSLRRVLETHGFQVDLAMNVVVAQELFSRRPRAIVLLDMRLNGDTGFDLLPELQRLNPTIAVIGMSGVQEMQALMQESLGEAFAGCFAKPLDLPRLTARLQELAHSG